MGCSILNLYKLRDVVKIDSILIFLSKILLKLCKAFGGGSSLPGRILLKLRPGILSRLSIGYKVIIVTGTNGKTTTASMITSVLKTAGKKVINNSSGANMTDGIASCFIENYKKCGWAVIECDEAYTRIVMRYIKPEYMVVTNIFRDQLDRFGEIYTTWEKIKDAIALSPSTELFLNADEAIFAETEFKNKVHYFGFSQGNGKMSSNVDSAFCKNCGERFKFNFITFKNLGDYYCPKCGFSRPAPEFTLDEIKSVTVDGSVVMICSEEVTLSVSGVYNMYNALAAFAVAMRAGIDKETIARGIASQQSRFGRNEMIDVGGTKMQLSLIKNPTGCDQCIDTITLFDKPCSLLILLNDNWADGTDVSWVWDAHFENLKKLEADKIIIGGTRRFDMAVRLETAGFDEKKFIIAEDDDAVIGEISGCGNRVFALATYTAMTGLRRTMYKKGIVKKMWK